MTATSFLLFIVPLLASSGCFLLEEQNVGRIGNNFDKVLSKALCTHGVKIASVVDLPKFIVKIEKIALFGTNAEANKRLDVWRRCKAVRNIQRCMLGFGLVD